MFSTKVKGSFKRVAFGFFLIFALIMILKPCWGQKSSPDTNAQVQSDSQQKLQEAKLRQEIIKLELENQRLKNFWAQLPSYGAVFTALIALVGIFVTIWKQIIERSRQQQLDRRQRELDRQQREDESLRRLDEKFASVVADLGSERPPTQASAAVSIMSFLRPEYKVFHHQVFLILLANLKIEHDDAINKLLIGGFEKAIRIRLQSAEERDELFVIDLSRCFLNRVDLSNLELKNADIGFAELRGANLTGVDLYRVRGMSANLEKARLSRANLEEARLRKAQFSEAQFHEANLISADLEETDLRKAQLQKAKLQSAHLDNADLRGARFEQANLSDTFLRGATLNEDTLSSILKGYNWQKAHFDKKAEAKLRELAATDRSKRRYKAPG